MLKTVNLASVGNVIVEGNIYSVETNITGLYIATFYNTINTNLHFCANGTIILKDGFNGNITTHKDNIGNVVLKPGQKYGSIGTEDCKINTLTIPFDLSFLRFTRLLSMQDIYANTIRGEILNKENNITYVDLSNCQDFGKYIFRAIVGPIFEEYSLKEKIVNDRDIYFDDHIIDLNGDYYIYNS